MKLVVDASVVLGALVDTSVPGIWSDEVIARADAILAPEVMPVEVANVLRRLERAGRIDRRRASIAFTRTINLGAELMPFAPFADRVWALRHNLTSYDAVYVAIAEAFDATLATLDTRLARAPGIHCETLSPT